MSQEYPNLELNAALYLKVQKPCCASGCATCPYFPRYKGLDGLQYLNPMVLAQFNEISVRTARNDSFKHLPDAEQRIIRLKERTATSDDIRSFFNDFYIPNK
jgi:hypothetical protein